MNCVDDSSEPRVCTCQTLAVLLPQLGHSNRIVGMVVSCCSSLPITATNCLGSCSMYFPLNLALGSASPALRPHFWQANIIRTWFPLFTLTGFNLEPHSLQNSISCSSPEVANRSFYSIADLPVAIWVYHPYSNSTQSYTKINIVVATRAQQLSDTKYYKATCNMHS